MGVRALVGIRITCEWLAAVKVRDEMCINREYITWARVRPSAAEETGSLGVATFLHLIAPEGVRLQWVAALVLLSHSVDDKHDQNDGTEQPNYGSANDSC